MLIDVTSGSMSAPRDGAAALGRRLRHARLDRGLSQSALAAGICSASAISRWESGHSLPPAEALLPLARRLDIDVHLLTGEGFDSRLAESTSGFADLLGLALGDSPGSITSPMASWIARAQGALRCADPWSPGDPRALIEDLSLDPLGSSTPAALETIEVLDALARVGEEPGAGSVNRLVDVLTLTLEAPDHVRRAALEAAVASLVFLHMPVAARGAVIRISPPRISETTRVLLTWDTPRCDPQDSTPLPPLSGARTARDVAFVLAERYYAEGAPKAQAAAAAAACLPEDALVARWAEWVKRNERYPTLFQG
ncbi:Helix-turn-helix domain protein [Corynebacterium oculi]|uniref:Helix-turn-helix domain protein n=2 Tax=Corynebacterium oculi TaxID=1544416 RepID=A0A0Q0YLB6_9CORY|nr:Helix-turn-helix domain protein [Corynebacterium oculi]